MFAPEAADGSIKMSLPATMTDDLGVFGGWAGLTLAIGMVFLGCVLHWTWADWGTAALAWAYGITIGMGSR